MIEGMPLFVPPIVRRTAQVCPVPTAELLREQMSSKWPSAQAAAAELAVRSLPGQVSALAAQAIINIADAKIHPRYEDERRRHTETHSALLRTAALSCDVLAANLDRHIQQQSGQRRQASEALIGILERIRTGEAGEFCSR
jgi:hypothetical protein